MIFQISDEALKALLGNAVDKGIDIGQSLFSDFPEQPNIDSDIEAETYIENVLKELSDDC